MNINLADTLSGLYDITLRLDQKIESLEAHSSSVDLNIDGLSGIMEALSGLQQQIVSSELDEQQEVEIQPNDGDIIYTVHPSVIFLSGSTSYNLESDKFYRCEILDDTTFRLPATTALEPTEIHEIYLVTVFRQADEVNFINADNNVVTTLDENEWDPSDVVQYICRYEPFVGRWVIIPSKIAEANS